MKTEMLGPIGPGENPFLTERFLMGTALGTNLVVMYPKHEDRHQPFVLLVDKTTGERMRVTFALDPEKAGSSAKKELRRLRVASAIMNTRGD